MPLLECPRLRVKDVDFSTTVGVSTSQLIWAIATSVGIVAILLVSEAVFYAVKVAGAAYLIGLGARSMQ